MIFLPLYCCQSVYREQIILQWNFDFTITKYNKDLGIMNDIHRPSINSKIYGKEPSCRHSKTLLEQTHLPVGWLFVILRFHCTVLKAFLFVEQNSNSQRGKMTMMTSSCFVKFVKFSTYIMDVKRERSFRMSAGHLVLFNCFNWIWKTIQK